MKEFKIDLPPMAGVWWPAMTPASRDRVTIRGIPFDLPRPDPRLRNCVVVPARNEELALPAFLSALAAQGALDGSPLPASSYEVILLLNNCTDRSREVAAELQDRCRPRLCLHIVEVTFADHEAHVGRARQALFDLALHRFDLLQRPSGLILTSDADSLPAGDWIAQNEAEIAKGVSGVGGRIVLDPAEAACLPPAVRRFLLLDIGYRRALEELRSLYAPEAHDPFPRHHQHFGGSLAVTARAYKRSGGMPLCRSNEDVALYRALLAGGERFRHSYQVRVLTSARVIGRARGGLADALGWWHDQASENAPVLVESAAAADERLAQLGRWQRDQPGVVAPSHLSCVPEPPPADTSAEIQTTLRALRVRCAELRRMTLLERIKPTEKVVQHENAWMLY